MKAAGHLFKIFCMVQFSVQSYVSFSFTFITLRQEFLPYSGVGPGSSGTLLIFLLFSVFSEVLSFPSHHHFPCPTKFTVTHVFHPVDETCSIQCCSSTILKLLSKYFKVIFF